MAKLKYLLIGMFATIGLSSLVAAAASWNLPPAIQRGDLIVATSSTQSVRLATGTAGSVLFMNPSTNVPSWTATSTLGFTGSGGGVTTLATGTASNIFNGSISGSTLTLNLPLASGSNTGQLQSSDWTTFNNKQSAISLTTTGTSGAATFGGNTLNVPQYQAVLTNPVTGTGSNGDVARWTSGSAIGAGVLFDNGSVAGVSATSSTAAFEIQGTGSLDPLEVNTSTSGSLFHITKAGNVQLPQIVNQILKTDVTGNIKGTPSTTALSLFSTLTPDSSGNDYLAAYSLNTTNQKTQQTAAYFLGTATKDCMYGNFTVPPDYTGDPRYALDETTASTTGATVWVVGDAVVAAGATMDIPAFNVASSTLNTQGTAQFLAQTNFTTTSTYASLSEVEFELCHDGTDANNKFVATSTVNNLRFIYAR